MLEFFLGKDQRVQEFFSAEKQLANCVHTSITRESAVISSTQVLFTEKCPGMNPGTMVSDMGGASSDLKKGISEKMNFTLSSVALKALLQLPQAS